MAGKIEPRERKTVNVKCASSSTCLMSVKIIRPRANTDQYCLSYRFAVHNICYYYQGNKTCQLSVNKVARQQNMSKLPPTKVMMSQYFHLLFGD